LAYFAPSTNQCLLGDDSVVIKSTQSNRLTVFYRANYAAVGRWQLYAQNIAVDAAGTMSLMGDKVNLHPNCTGNINGVTSFDVTEFEADQSTAGRRALDAKSLERAKSVKIAINCVNTARNVVRTIDLATLRDTTAATTRFLSKDGAVGYWPSKDLYIKGDGSTLTAAGQASSVKIPGGTASMSYSGSPLSTYDYSNTDARAYSSIAGTVTSARVKFTLQHTRMAELTVSLITPDGQNVTLMS
jgi:hypothetical protein